MAGGAARFWKRSKQLTLAKSSAMHLVAMNREAWTDVNALFNYYNDLYFNRRLANVAVRYEAQCPTAIPLHATHA